MVEPSEYNAEEVLEYYEFQDENVFFLYNNSKKYIDFIKIEYQTYK